MTQHFVITGANRGIGAAMARDLAARGHRLTLLCRDSEAALALIRTLPSGQGIVAQKADFGSLRGIAAAIRILSQLPPIDGLIHNAALWPQTRVLTEDGWEQSFVVNHLAPFLMNFALEKRFQQEGTRVVQMTAGLYPIGDRDFMRTATGANFSALKTYASTKLLNLATTMTFAARWQGTQATINAVHPGVVRTNLGAMRGIPGLFLKLIKQLWLTPEEGAKAPVFLSTDPALQGVSGRFYNRFQEQPLAPFMQDEAWRAAVWEQALQWTNKVS